MRAFTALGVVGLIGIACAATAFAQAGAPTATLRDHAFTIEIAATPAEQAHGLMDRASMPRDHGMLFVFPDSAPRTFWMKNTLIPLDMVFFNAARRVVAIQADAQPCRADPCRVYPSNVPARYVLELNAGTAQRLGLRKGDVMTLSGVAADTQ